MTDKKNGRHDLGNCIIWYKDSLVHRDDGPAIEWSHGTKEWHINNQLHREDGPAMEYALGTKKWYLHDNQLTEEEFNQWLEKKNLNAKLEDTLLPKPMMKRVKI